MGCPNCGSTLIQELKNRGGDTVESCPNCDHFWITKKYDGPSPEEVVAGLVAAEPKPFTFEDCTPTELTFLTILASIQSGVHSVATAKGFWEGDMDQPLSKLMLIVTEAAEMAEAFRKPAFSDKLPGLTLQEEEAADILIRLLDLCGRYNMRLGLATLAKMRYNSKREYQHGGKLY